MLKEISGYEIVRIDQSNSGNPEAVSAAPAGGTKQANPYGKRARKAPRSHFHRQRLAKKNLQVDIA
jgi:hypothetical protein